MAFVRRIAILVGSAGSLMLAYSCGSKGSTNPPPPTVNTISKFSGDSQVGSAGAAVGANLVVFVQAQNSSPVSGATVTWTASSGGGAVTSGTSQTDANGHAAMGRTLGPAAGFQTTTASLSGATGSPITFTSISQIQGAFTIAATAGGGQLDTVLSTLATPFQATVTDHAGAPVAGVIVTFSVTAGGGLLSQAVDTSDASGHVTAALTLPSTAGAQTVHAAVTGLLGSPVTFNATATAGNAAQMAKSTGDSQIGLISTALPSPHQVLIRDAHGNLVSGFAIHWRLGSGGGSVSDTAPASDAAGVVSIIRSLGGTLGTQTDTAVSTLSGSPIAFVSTGDSVAHAVGVTVGPGIVFAPNSVKIGSVGTVTFTWAANSIAHGVEWLTGPGTLPANSAVQSSGTYQAKFSTPGTYTYNCIVHGSSMSGTVIVR